LADLLDSLRTTLFDWWCLRQHFRYHPWILRFETCSVCVDVLPTSQ